MIGIMLGFVTYVNVVIFCVLFGAIVWWAWVRIRDNREFCLWPFLIVQTGLLVLWCLLAGASLDESEHLHCSWLVSQGLVPFTDFWQHHSPLIWLVIAPVMKFITPTAEIFELSRLAGAVFFVLIGAVGWRIARQAWGGRANPFWYCFLLVSVGSSGQFMWLRPDLFMVFFLLAGILISLDIPGERLYPAFCAGFFFALAYSFIPKQYLVCLLPVMLIALEKHSRWPLKIGLYVLGFFAGCLPLAWYLISHHIVREFFYWALWFNNKIVVSMVFPLVFVLLGAWGTCKLIARYRIDRDLKVFGVISAFILSTVSSLTGRLILNGQYYLMGWFIMAAIVGCGVELKEIAGRKSKRAQAMIVAAVLALLLLPGIMCTFSYRNTLLSKDKVLLRRLVEYSRSDSCLAIVPLHPVFAKDAIRIYSDWQYQFFDFYPSVSDDAQSKGDIAQQIISARPAVIMHRYLKRDFILDLFQKKLILAQGYKQLVAFLKQEYTIMLINKNSFYIRNDLVKK